MFSRQLRIIRLTYNKAMSRIISFLALLVYLVFSACQTVPGNMDRSATQTHSDLRVTEFAISQLPVAESDELEAVLDAVRKDARFQYDRGAARVNQIPYCTGGEIQGMCVTLDLDELIAVEAYDQAGNGQVTVTRNGAEIYTIPVGDASPITALRGLWAWEESWVLETVLIHNSQDGNAISSETIGQITQDGMLLNDRYGYDEAYEFQLLDGKPFYLFRRGTSIDASFNGVEYPLGYTEIIHYGCCSASMLNPLHYTDHLDFFARKGERWYTVEIGIIKS